MGYLSEALGIELKPIATEAVIENFSLDILAENSFTGERVVIENQLDHSDHSHLGQVLTYVAGTDAKYVIWIARQFQAAHRSAVRCLNEHTASDFSFFAVQLRVVQIGDSPFAPIFDIVEQPNDWEKALRTKTAIAESELTQLRQRFWNRYLEKFPGSFAPSKHSNVWVPMLSDGNVVLSMYVGSNTSGMFLRGRFGGDVEHLERFMSHHADALESALGPNQSKHSGHFHLSSCEIAVQQEARWDNLIDWMEEKRKLYAETLRDIAEQAQG